MKQYIDYIEDYEKCTKEDLIDVVNQLSDRLNYVLNVMYSSGDMENMFCNDFKR